MKACRACKSSRLFLFLPLGDHPPANGFVAPDRLDGEESKFPLDAHVCLDCGLIQVEDQVPPGFFHHYVYLPSASPLMQRHFAGLAGEIYRRYGREGGLVVDVGCNDGLFLRSLQQLGGRPLGIDPATNIVETVQRDGIDVVNDYFTPEVAAEVRRTRGPATILVTTNTFHHVGDLDVFMEAVLRLLGPEGVFVVEVPHCLPIVEQSQFDGIYHEHVSQFSVKAFVDLLARFDMSVFEVQPLSVHGGSIRVFARRGSGAVLPEVASWIEAEVQAGLFESATYVAFRERVEGLRDELMDLLRELRAGGARLAGYGASARGNTVLNYYGIGTELLAYVVDRNPLKQGLYTPGMHLPVRPPEALIEDRPDYVLLLAWNFGAEVLEQQREYLESGGRFILPLPEVRMVDAAGAVP
jgi:SAM-dependent methyltransferase